MKRLRALMLGIVSVGAIVIGSPAVFAKLARSRLDDLIAQSDVILQAGVMRLEAGDAVTGTRSSAVLRVWHVLKGSYASQTVTIHFSDEQHEQLIATLYEDRLLFLKKTASGEYEGSHYGRSYWPLEWTVEGGPKLVTPYVYPTNIISVPDTLLKDAEIIVPLLGLEKQHVKAIYLEDMMSLVSAGKPKIATYEERLVEVKPLVAKITPGMTRTQVETWLKEKDGGLQGVSVTRYYEQPEVMIEVPFDQTGGDWSQKNRVNGSIKVYRSLQHFD